MITETEERIINRIHITPELYAEFMYESGCLWLEKLKEASVPHFKGIEHKVPGIFESIVRNPLFWKWWTLEWQATDRAFLMSRVESRGSYFTRQIEAVRDMPSNVSMQLLRYAARHKLPEEETRPATETAGGVNRTVTERI